MSAQSTPQQLERLQAVNQHLRIVMDHSKEGILILEPGPLEAPGPRIVYSNQVMARLTGRPQASLHQLPLGVLVSESFFLQLAPGFVSTSEEHPWTSRGPLCGPDGEEVMVDWRICATRDGKGNCLNYMIFVSAIESFVSGGRAGGPVRILSDDPNDLPTPDQYQGDLVTNVRETARRVAHEFNNALTAIYMPLGMAARCVGEGSDLKEKLDLAQMSAQKAAGLAKDFLDCFRPRVACKERTDLKELLSRTLRLATVSEHVNWELSVPDDLLPAEVDPEQIDRVIFNLVRNACDAMNNHGHLSVRAQNVNLGKENPLQMEPGNYVSITVRDYGPGIPAENMKHLFHSRFTTKPNGNGCGLPICHHVIKDHGGEIFVSSKESVGTAFAIFLPACDLVSLPKNLTPQPTAADLTAPSANASDPTPVASAPAAAATKEAPVIFTGPPTILIVDDDDVIRMVTSEIARQLGYEVESAAEGEEALNILRSRQKEHRRMDGILMDINLRGKRNGVDTLHEIHRMEITIPVIATSGEHRDQTYYQALGFQRFLAKPYKVEELDKILRETLAS